MPDTLTEIRERDAAIKDVWYLDQTATDRRALLAHIDALTAEVEGLPGYRDPRYGGQFEAKGLIDRAAVLAIFRGE